MNIEERVKRVVAEQLGYSEEWVKNTHSFVDDLNADSLDEVEILMAIEEEFEFEISDEEARTVKTVQEAIDLVEAKLK